MSEEKKEAVKKKAAKVDSYSFIGKGRFDILGVDIINGFKLVKEIKENKNFMKRFNHALKIGVIKKD